MLTLVGLISTIMVLTSFVFMATKFNPEKTKEHASDLLKTAFPAYQVTIDDVSVKIGLVASVTLKNLKINKTGTNENVIFAPKIQVKTSLSSVVFKKKPIDVIVDAVKIDLANFSDFVHRHFTSDLLTNPNLNLPDFVRKSGVNFKVRNLESVGDRFTLIFERLTLKARTGSLWAYEIEGNHSLKLKGEEIRLQHITVGEISFFEKAAQISILSQTNELFSSIGSSHMKDVKIQGTLDVPVVGDMTASLSIIPADKSQLSLSWFESDGMSLREISGNTSFDYIKFLDLHLAARNFSKGHFSFSKSANSFEMKQVNDSEAVLNNEKVKEYSFAENENKKSLNILIMQAAGDAAINFESDYLDFTKVYLRLNTFQQLFSHKLEQILLSHIHFKDIETKRASFNIDILNCTRVGSSCSIDFVQMANGKFSGIVKDQNKVDLFKVALELNGQQNGFDISLINIPFSLMDIEFPVDGNCILKIQRKISQTRLTGFECNRGEFNEAILGLSASNNSKLSFKNLKLSIDNDQYSLMVTPLKGRTIKFNGFAQRLGDDYLFYIDERKELGFKLERTAKGFKFLPIGNDR